MPTAGGRERARVEIQEDEIPLFFFLLHTLTFSSNSNDTFTGSCIIVAKFFKVSN